MTARGLVRRTACAVPLLALLGAAPQRQAPRPVYGPPPPPSPYDQCDAATAGARTRLIPETLLPAIARVESGRLDPATGRVRSWPWTINVDGVGTFFETKADAVATVLALQARGTRSIDIGCMQVNLYYHPNAFPSVEAAFDPPTNAAYAVTFLTALHGQFKDWGLATAAYHSQAQAEGEDYQRRVFGRVMTPMGPPSGFAVPGGKWPPAGVVFGAIPPASAMFGAFPPASQSFGAFAPSTAFGAFGTFAPAAPAAAAKRPGRR